ncbi:GtrA family protein [Rudaeicoccus suwonensis]|uniref:GtrA family protein n=1 Tax=Rudaeicoccus suwonensis TaxID=657409 RepID=UPI001BA6D992|nr:GtrA family protein [Rudaeicoccus suwonensis]
MQADATAVLSFPQRLRRVAPQLSRFAAIGGVGFLVDVGGFNLLRYAGSDGHGPLYSYVLGAKLISSTLGVIVAWLGNRYWVFRHERRDELHHEFAMFTIVSLVGIGIALACLWFSHYALGLTSQLNDNISANVVGLGLATVFRFWGYKRLVFISGRR